MMNAPTVRSCIGQWRVPFLLEDPRGLGATALFVSGKSKTTNMPRGTSARRSTIKPSVVISPLHAFKPTLRSLHKVLFSPQCRGCVSQKSLYQMEAFEDSEPGRR